MHEILSYKYKTGYHVFRPAQTETMFLFGFRSGSSRKVFVLVRLRPDLLGWTYRKGEEERGKVSENKLQMEHESFIYIFCEPIGLFYLERDGK